MVISISMRAIDIRILNMHKRRQQGDGRVWEADLFDLPASEEMLSGKVNDNRWAALYGSSQ